MQFQSLWKGLIERPQPRGSERELRQILADTCADWGISEGQLRSDFRSKPYVHARWDFCHRAYATGRYSYHRIGRFLKRDHTTVRHGDIQWRTINGLSA